MNETRRLIIPTNLTNNDVLAQLLIITEVNNINIDDLYPEPSVNNIYCRIIETCTEIDRNSNYDDFLHILLEISKFHTINEFTHKHSHSEASLAESFMLMSGAYLIRELAYLSMLHGSLTTNEDIEFSTKSNFSFCQLMTRQDQEFQLSSCKAGSYILKSKITDIELNGLGKLVRCCKHYGSQIEFPSLTGHYIEKHSLITFVKNCTEKADITAKEVNSFIFNNRKVNERL